MMKNTRLYTFAVLFDRQLTPKRNLVYMKSRDKLATSDIKLSSRIGPCPLWPKTFFLHRKKMEKLGCKFARVATLCVSILEESLTSLEDKLSRYFRYLNVNISCRLIGK